MQGFVAIDEQGNAVAIFSGGLTAAKYAESAKKDYKQITIKEVPFNPTYQPELPFGIKVRTPKACVVLYTVNHLFIEAGYIKDSPELLDAICTKFLKDGETTVTRDDEATGAIIVWSIVSREEAFQKASFLWNEIQKKNQMELGI